MFGKKKEPEYTELTGLLGVGADYHVYHMTKKDYLTAWLIGAAVGIVVIFAFFRSLLFTLAGAVIAAMLAPGYYCEFRKKQRLNQLRLQFKDLLESLTASYSAGKNTVDAFQDAKGDMESIYGSDADIVDEVQIICTGLSNNINIEQLLLDFAKRCGLSDVMSFANVFEVCNRQGSDLKRIVSETRDILNDKIEIEMEIQTTVAANKNEINIMCVMPFVIIAMMGTMGQASITANTPLNVLVKLIAIFMFVIAYKLGRKITDIKV